MSKKLKNFILKSILIILMTMYYSYCIFKPLSYFYYHSLNIKFIFNLDNILKLVRYIFPISTIISSLIFSYIFFRKLFSNIFIENTYSTTFHTNENMINIGTNLEENFPVYLNNLALYQNIIVTGSIGSGKTSGIIYPLIEQFSRLNYPGLILDVKGNMQEYIENILNKNNRLDDLVIIEINGKYKYNPLNKPNIKPYVLANRLIEILQLFSKSKNTDTYWYDKAETMLTNIIKLIRLYNDEYVTFAEIHNIINDNNLLLEKLSILKENFLNNQMNETDQYDFKQILLYFRNEYTNLDSKVSSIIHSEITRITSIFVSDIDIEKTFSPPKKDISFNGFENIYNRNSIVLLKMNIGEYSSLSKLISCYLKLDFQSEVLKQNTFLAKPIFFVCDEYQEYLTKNDVNFYSLSREFKCINIVSTQSYSSLLNTLESEHSFNVLIQNFINKIFLRTDDIFTIEQMQKLFGKEEKTKFTNTLSENANETNYNYFLNIMKSKKSNISESFSSYTVIDNLFDSKDFSLNLKSFEAICYISTGNSMLKPFKLQLNPYFERRDNRDLLQK